MRVCKHGCDVKRFCFSHANHEFQKVSESKTRQVYFIYPLLCHLKLGTSLQTSCVNFVFAEADILSDKNPHLGSHLFAKQELITRASPNPSHVYITLCKHGKRFQLLKYPLQCSQKDKMHSSY